MVNKLSKLLQWKTSLQGKKKKKSFPQINLLNMASQPRKCYVLCTDLLLNTLQVVGSTKV